MRLNADRRLLLLLLTPWLHACSGSTHREVTYYRDVEPIVQEKCQGCHVPDGIAPFSLQTFAQTRDHSERVAASLHSGDMPPWPPGRDGLPMRLDRSLSDDQQRVIDDWVRQGAVAGDLRDHRAHPPIKVGVRADLSLAMPAPYTPTNAQEDDYRCYLLDPQLDRDRWVTGYSVQPGVAAMVHHVNLYLITDPETIADRAENEGMDGQPGYQCLGGPGGLADKTSSILGGWEPGAQAVTFPEHTALRIPAGAHVVMLMHYTTANVRKPDLTRVDFQFGERPDLEASVLELRNESLKVPPGEKNYPVTQVQAIGPDFSATRIYGMFPHMHFFGTAVSVKLQRRGQNGEVTLIDIPKWEYHWQGMYFLVDPVEVKPGDQLRLTCVYDNSAANQPFVDGMRQAPRLLTWGPRALDEMCLSYVYVTGGMQPVSGSDSTTSTHRGR